MAIFMFVADSSKKGTINLKNHKYSDSFLIGLFQAFAIFSPAFLQVSKSFMGIECNEGLVIPLTSGLPPGPCL